MPIEQIFSPRPSDIGGMMVRRLLPKSVRQSVGPFLFFDHMGPLSHVPGEDHDVPPHPHIGFATAHSERMPDDLKGRPHTLHGV